MRMMLRIDAAEEPRRRKEEGNVLRSLIARKESAVPIEGSADNHHHQSRLKGEKLLPAVLDHKICTRLKGFAALVERIDN